MSQEGYASGDDDRTTVYDDGSTQEPCPRGCGAYLIWTFWAAAKTLLCPDKRCGYVAGNTATKHVYASAATKRKSCLSKI